MTYYGSLIYYVFQKYGTEVLVYCTGLNPQTETVIQSGSKARVAGVAGYGI